jgi:putative transposase
MPRSDNVLASAAAATGGNAPAEVVRRHYPSDLTDRQWRKVHPLLPPPPPQTGRPRSTNLRDVLSAINYRWTTGCAWRMLPHDFPPWGTVYTYFRHWGRSGVLPEVRAQLLRSGSRRNTRDAADAVRSGGPAPLE